MLIINQIISKFLYDWVKTKTYFGTSLDSDQAFVEHIYLNTLGKTLAQDPDGIAFWVNALATNSRGFVVAELIKSATDAATAGAAQDQFNNRVEVSNYMADTVQTAPADYATSTAFTSAAKPTGALNVTSDAATVTAAKAATDVLADAAKIITYTITPSAASVTECNSITFTVTASEAKTTTATTFNWCRSCWWYRKRGDGEINLSKALLFYFPIL